MPRLNRQIIIAFNGVGSSGKSSTARALQEIAAVPLLHVAMDSFLEMLPDRMFGDPDGLVFKPARTGGQPAISIETGIVCQRLLAGMRQSVVALARQGLSLIVDDVMLGDEAQEYRRLLTGFDLRFVGFFLPLDVVEQREARRGDREIGLARGQHGLIRRGDGYDIEIDDPEATP